MDAASTEQLLKVMVDWQGDPPLDQETIDALMSYAANADSYGNAPVNVDGVSWVSGAVLVGAVILDSNGRYWRALTPGTTGATEPNWPTPLSYSQTTKVTDGSVTWIDLGTEWSPSYSIDVAAAMGWRLKAGLVASRFGFLTDGQQFNRNQVHGQCLAMAMAYERRCASTIEVLL